MALSAFSALGLAHLSVWVDRRANISILDRFSSVSCGSKMAVDEGVIGATWKSLLNHLMS